MQTKHTFSKFSDWTVNYERIDGNVALCCERASSAVDCTLAKRFAFCATDFWHAKRLAFCSTDFTYAKRSASGPSNRTVFGTVGSIWRIPWNSGREKPQES